MVRRLVPRLGLRETARLPPRLDAGPIVRDVVNNPVELDRSFGALAHPVRRGIVERLSAGPATVAVATSGLGVSKPAISRHLKVLEEAGVMSRVVEGRTHRLALRDGALTGAASWIERYRALWERKLDVVDTYLKEQS
jgi:DNA-binding transcriptional ArsR family regulator